MLRTHLALLGLAVLLGIGLGLTCEARADPTLPAVFGDHWCSSASSRLAVWGRRRAGRAGHGLGRRTQRLHRDRRRRPLARGPARAARPAARTSSPSRGARRLHLRDVLVGEVWICSGQSNMEWPRRAATRRAGRRSRPPTIRESACSPCRGDPHSSAQDDVEARWALCSPETVARLLGRGVLLRPRAAPGARRADRAGQHLLGRHAGRGVDAARARWTRTRRSRPLLASAEKRVATPRRSGKDRSTSTGPATSTTA